MLHCMASCYISRHLASQYSHLKNKIEMKIFVILLIPLFAPPYVYPPHPLDDFSLPFSSDSIEEFILPALNSLIVNHPTSNSSFASCYVERFYKIMKQQHWCMLIQYTWICFEQRFFRDSVTRKVFREMKLSKLKGWCHEKYVYLIQFNCKKFNFSLQFWLNFFFFAVARTILQYCMKTLTQSVEQIFLAVALYPVP